MVSLPQAWLQRGALAWALRPVSLLYGALTAVRRGLYRQRLLRSEKIGVPIIIVGNVIAGGSGKTPVVMAIVRHLDKKGIRVGVISRGYGRKTDDCREVLDDSDPRDVGDEPALIRHSTGVPAFVGRRRVEAGRALLAHHPDTQVIISDDGLQHLAMDRDVEICVFDDRGVGNGWLLPAGPLREAWPRRCDLVLHTGKHPAFAGFTARRALASHALRSDGSRISLDALADRKLIAIAAIAKPEAFFEMLRERAVPLARCIALPDHFDFADWNPPGLDGHTLICTEKDAVKLWRKVPDALAVPLAFEPEPAFFSALDAKLSSLDGHQAA